MSSDAATHSLLDPLRNLLAAIFVGVPDGEDAAKYTFEVTSLISIYICVIVAFLGVLFIRRLGRSASIADERRNFLLAIAYSLVASMFGIALYVGWLLYANG